MNKFEASQLSKVGIEEIKVLKKDFKLIGNGVKIFYVVDTYDVIEFCFPTLANVNDGVKHSIASSYLAYDFFFLHNKNKPVILDEYKVELFGMWNEIHREANRLMGGRTTREAEVERIKDKLKQDKDNLGRNIGLLLSLSLGFLSESALLQYKKVLNERLQIDHFDTENENDRLILEGIFNTTFSSEKSLELFDSFCKDGRRVIAGKSHKDKYAYLENAFRDIVVFERIININKAIQKRQDLEERYLFLYLSSTPNKSIKIDSLFTAEKLLPRIYGYLQYPMLRNISQFYLGELIQGSTYDSENSERFKTMQLEKCLEILEEGHSRDRLADKLADELSKQIDQFNKKINLNRNELENRYLLANTYYSYKDRILQAVENNDQLFDDDMKRIVEELFAELDKNKDKNNQLLLTLNNYRDEFVIQSKLMRYLQAAREDKKIIKLVPGHDPVRSAVQLYPVMLFYPNFGKETFSPLLNFFTDVVQSHTHHEDSRNMKFVGLKQFDRFYLDSYEKRLYYLFLDLVIPDEKPLQPNKDNEKMLIVELRKLYAVNTKRNAEWIFTDNRDSIDVFLFPRRDFEIEVVYFLSWLYRRSRSYKQALFYLNRTIDRYYPIDARLLHSRALCHISMIYEGLGVSISLKTKWMNQALQDLSDSLHTFELDIKLKPNKLLRHVIITIKNTKADLLTKLFHTNPDKYLDLIDADARPLLNSFKKDLDNLNEDYSRYPTYNHTEVDVECCEAIVALRKGDQPEARRKISLAKRRYVSIVKSQALDNYPYLQSTGELLAELSRQANTKM